MVEGKVQAHPVAVGEAVLIPVGVRIHAEAERRVVRQDPPQVAHRKHRAEALKAGTGHDSSVHDTSMPHAPPSARGHLVRLLPLAGIGRAVLPSVAANGVTRREDFTEMLVKFIGRAGGEPATACQSLASS
jgi:hypothetical protein